MFERAAHRRVAGILQALDAAMLARCGFLFSEGTRIVLELGEYRLSEDIDFLCSDRSGYADLRSQVSERAYGALFAERDLPNFSFPREIRTDQYGIRFPLVFEGEGIKVELIREARMAFSPGVRFAWSAVDCLSTVDCFAEKLLANSDRWADRQFLSRDLIDLGALRFHRGPIPQDSWLKVEEAYKGAARIDLRRAAAYFLDHEDYRNRCFHGLSVTDAPAILDGISALVREA